MTNPNCDLCDRPGTDDNPIAHGWTSCGIETYYHADGCPKTTDTGLTTVTPITTIPPCPND